MGRNDEHRDTPEDTDAGLGPDVRGARVHHLEVGGEKLAVLTLPHEEISLPESLSATEREVALLAIAGLSDAEIAASRQKSARTIANQLRSIYEKLGVNSRAELAARVRRRR